MTKPNRTSLCLLCVFLTPALLITAAEDAHVVLISIDGFAAYHLQNPELQLPNIRELMRSGVTAESSETVFPSITHPSHTTMITGVAPRIHGVVGNTVRNRKTGESFHITNKKRSESILVPTIFDAARKKGLPTAAFFWPETREDPSVDYNLPETFGAGESPDITAVDPALLQRLRAGGVPIDLYYRWYGDRNLKGAADAVLAQAAAFVIKTHQPRLLAIHLLATDSIQHSYGPEHYLSAAALTHADYCVGILRRAVRETGIEGRTTFFIVADHGFHSVKFEVNLHPLLRESGLLDRITVHPGGWACYLELKESFDVKKDMPALERLLEKAERVAGVSRVIRPEEFHGLGLPKYEESPYIPGQFLILADIDTHLVSSATGATIERVAKASPSHGHGYLPGHPRMYPAFVVSGYRINRGESIGHITNFEIAPTISHLLDLGMTGFTGRILKEALTH